MTRPPSLFGGLGAVSFCAVGAYTPYALTHTSNAATTIVFLQTLFEGTLSTGEEVEGTTKNPNVQTKKEKNYFILQ